MRSRHKYYIRLKLIHLSYYGHVASPLVNKLVPSAGRYCVECYRRNVWMSSKHDRWCSSAAGSYYKGRHIKRPYHFSVYVSRNRLRVERTYVACLGCTSWMPRGAGALTLIRFWENECPDKLINA